MKKLLSIVAAAIFMVSCGTINKAKQVDYTEAHGYFVRNDAPSHPSCYYDSKEAFDSIFGCAAFMGEGGTPTQIDFTRQSVIAVIGCETNRPTKYIPVSLMSQADTLCLKYKVEEADPTTYTMVPLLLLLLDKAYASPNIKLEKQ